MSIETLPPNKVELATSNQQKTRAVLDATMNNKLRSRFLWI